MAPSLSPDNRPAGTVEFRVACAGCGRVGYRLLERAVGADGITARDLLLRYPQASLFIP